MRVSGRPGQLLLSLMSVMVLVTPLGVGSSFSPSPRPLSDARSLLPHITEALMQGYLTHLCAFGPRYTGTLACSRASEWIYSQFAALGLPVEYHPWKFGKFSARDVVATLPGRLPESQGVYVVCGHYDSVKVSPGADDDGSGAMAVLAIADALHGQLLDHTVRFITFAGEEVGTYGSYFYAREAAARGDNIIGVLNMDMIGYANTTEGGRILQFHTVERSLWIDQFAGNVSSNYRDVVDIAVKSYPNYRGSDHQAFLDYGYDAVWIDHQDGYPWGHSQNDTTAHINWTYYTKATRYMLALTWEMAMRPIPLQVRLTAPKEGTDYFFNKQIAHLGFPRDWFTERRGMTIIVGRAMAQAEVISSDPIQNVVFCIDDNFMVWESTPPYEWKIEGVFAPIMGKHTLKVFAYTTTGRVATDEMDIWVLSHARTWHKHG